MQSRFQATVPQDNIYHLPLARGVWADTEDRTAAVGPMDLLFVDLNYVMAARLCPRGHSRKLHPTAIEALRPRHVPLACALFGRVIDGFEMTALLSRIGYQGQLTIVRPALPDPELIRAELKAQAHGFRLRLIRDHWLGGANSHWSQFTGSERAQPLRKTAGLGAIPRR